MSAVDLVLLHSPLVGADFGRRLRKRSTAQPALLLHPLVSTQPTRGVFESLIRLRGA